MMVQYTYMLYSLSGFLKEEYVMFVHIRMSKHEEVMLKGITQIRNVGGIYRLIDQSGEELFVKPNNLLSIGDE